MNNSDAGRAKRAWPQCEAVTHAVKRQCFGASAEICVQHAQVEAEAQARAAEARAQAADARAQSAESRARAAEARAQAAEARIKLLQAQLETSICRVCSLNIRRSGNGLRLPTPLNSSTLPSSFGLMGRDYVT